MYLIQELINLGKPKGPRSPFNIYMSENFEEARGVNVQVCTLSWCDEKILKCFLFKDDQHHWLVMQPLFLVSFTLTYVGLDVYNWIWMVNHVDMLPLAPFRQRCGQWWKTGKVCLPRKSRYASKLSLHCTLLPASLPAHTVTLIRLSHVRSTVSWPKTTRCATKMKCNRGRIIWWKLAEKTSLAR